MAFMFHRFVWENKHGPIPKGYSVNHKCKNEDVRMLTIWSF